MPYEEDQVIWQYWEGDLPPVYELCMETMEKQNPGRVVRVDDAKFKELRGEGPPYEYLERHHRSDYVRSWLLATYGGIYVDADCVCVKPLDPLFELLKVFEFIGYGVTTFGSLQKFESAFCISRKGSVTATMWKTATEKLLDGETPLRWEQIGPAMLTKCAKKADKAGELVARLPTKLIQPIGYKKNGHLYWQEDNHDQLWTDTPFTWMMTHKIMKPLKELSRDDMFHSPTFAGHLIRRGLSL